MNILSFLVPAFMISLSLIPVAIALKPKKTKKIEAKKAKKIIFSQCLAFFGFLISTTILMILTKSTYATTEVAAQAVQNSAAGLTLCFKYIAAALSVGISCVGAGVGIGNGISSAIGACSENEKTFSKALMFIAFGEGIAIYGLVVAFLILFVA